MTIAVLARHPAVCRVTSGAVVGLTWAAGLRCWMVELAGDESAFSWSTELLVLAPGALVGAVCGEAAWCHAVGAAPPRWAAWSPVLLSSALLDPQVFHALVTNGQGSGALLVTGIGASGAVAFSRRGRSAGRVLAGVSWVAGVATVLAMGSIAGSPFSPRGALVCLTGAGLVGVLGPAAAATHPGGLLIGRAGRRWLATLAAATWLGTATLFLSQGWSWQNVTEAPRPLAVWAVTLGGGLMLTAATAAGSWRQPQTRPRDGVARGSRRRRRDSF